MCDYFHLREVQKKVTFTIISKTSRSQAMEEVLRSHSKDLTSTSLVARFSLSISVHDVIFSYTLDFLFTKRGKSRGEKVNTHCPYCMYLSWPLVCKSMRRWVKSNTRYSLTYLLSSRSERNENCSYSFFLVREKTHHYYCTWS